MQELLFYATNNATWAGAATPNVGPAAGATAGTSPASPVLASLNGPSLSGVSGTPFSASNTVFPLTQTVLTFNGGNVAADSATNAAGATLTIQTSLPVTPNVRLVVPNLNINVPVEVDFPPRVDGTGALSVTDVRMVTNGPGLNYTILGVWGFGHSSRPSPIRASSLPAIRRLRTACRHPALPAIKVPEWYRAWADNSSSPGAVAVVGGDAHLTANFSGSGGITGSFTNMTVATAGSAPYNLTSILQWNDVSVNASLTGDRTTFSGTTAAASAPAGPNAFSGSATGHIDGGFYGPNADEIGAVWSLSNNNGTATVVGTVGATKQ